MTTAKLPNWAKWAGVAVSALSFLGVIWNDAIWHQKVTDAVNTLTSTVNAISLQNATIQQSQQIQLDSHSRNIDILNFNQQIIARKVRVPQEPIVSPAPAPSSVTPLPEHKSLSEPLLVRKQPQPQITEGVSSYVK
jgi:hypothetical protein